MARVKIGRHYRSKRRKIENSAIPGPRKTRTTERKGPQSKVLKNSADHDQFISIFESVSSSTLVVDLEMASSLIQEISEYATGHLFDCANCQCDNKVVALKEDITEQMRWLSHGRVAQVAFIEHHPDHDSYTYAFIQRDTYTVDLGFYCMKCDYLLADKTKWTIGRPETAGVRSMDRAASFHWIEKWDIEIVNYSDDQKVGQKRRRQETDNNSNTWSKKRKVVCSTLIK